MSVVTRVARINARLIHWLTLMRVTRHTVLILLLSLSPSVHSDDKPLIVGSEQDYPPFALGLTDATADGFTVELWRAVAAESHLNATIRVLPFHEILQNFKEGKIDVLINLAQSDERRQFADFTVPHVIVHGAIFVHGKSAIHSEADLNTKRIIVLNADLAHDYALSKGWGQQLTLVNTAEEGFQLLASGQYDALLLSKLAGQQTLEKLHLTDIKALPIEVGFAQKFSFAVQKGNAELLAKINEGLAVTKASGVYDALYEKWFGVYEEKALLPLLLKYLAPVIGFFLFIISIILYRRNVEHKRVMRILQEDELRYRSLVNNIPDYVMRYDQQHRYVFANDRAIADSGKTIDDFIGKTHREMGFPEHLCALWEASIEYCFETAQPQTEIFEWQSAIGSSVLEWRVMPEYNSDGKLETVLAIARNITEHYQMEQALKTSEQKLAASNADLLQFTYIAAHHLQEPPRRLVSFVQRLSTQLQEINGLTDDISMLLTFIKQSAIRQRSLVRDIQLYLAATQPRAKQKNIVVHDILTKLLVNKVQLIQQTAATISYNYTPDVYLDAPRLYDIFDILLNNALQYGGRQGLHITIHGERRADRVVYQVADNGVGIPEEFRTRLLLVFERLQVTDNQESTGVGLSIVRRIVESCDGSIGLYETPQGGLTVAFDLPAAITAKHSDSFKETHIHDYQK